MEFSKFGQKMTSDAGILSLMDDLGKIDASAGSKVIMMGGGNPGHVEEFQELMRKQLATICEDRNSFFNLVGSYSPPQGDDGFIKSLAKLLRKEHGWDVGPENICLTNGSQTAFLIFLVKFLLLFTKANFLDLQCVFRFKSKSS